MLLVLDVSLGVLLLGAIAGLASRRQPTLPDALRRCGWVLIAVPLPLAVALHLTGKLAQTTDQALFVVGIAAFAIGAALVLGKSDDDWREADDDDSPPWWPQFEQDFWDYADRSRRKPRPTVSV